MKHENAKQMMTAKFWIRTTMETGHLRENCVNGRIILKWDMKQTGQYEIS
jgi:predicted metalloenzyme YecM